MANVKFIEWLTDWTKDAENRQLKNLFFCYRKALASLKGEQEALCPKDLIRLKGIGVNLVGKFEGKVKEYLRNGGAVKDLYSIPISLQLEQAVLGELPSSTASAPSTEKDGVAAATPASTAMKTSNKQKSGTAVAAPLIQSAAEVEPKKKRKTRYEPAYRSGAYGLLMCLFEHTCREVNGLTKTQLVENAQRYCDVSYRDPIPGGNQYYTAWSAMAQLIKKEMAMKQGFPPKYYLTIAGQDLAAGLWNKTLDFEKSNANGGQICTALPPIDESLLVQATEITTATSRTAKKTAAASRRGKKQLTMQQALQSSPTDHTADQAFDGIELVAEVNHANEEEIRSISLFQFTYLSFTSQMICAKDSASVSIDKASGVLKFKIQYPPQPNHPMQQLVIPAEPSDKAFNSGWLVGYLLDHDAPEQSPGISSSSTGQSASSSVASVAINSSLPPPFPSSRPVSATTTIMSASRQSHLDYSGDFHNNHIDHSLVDDNYDDDDDDDEDDKHFLWPNMVTEKESIANLPTREEMNCLPAGSFDIYLILDSREVRSQTSREFIQQQMERCGVPTITRALDLGDMLWVARSRLDRGTEVVLDYVVERKRLDDLVSSIKDGRFKEQKVRLAGCCLQHKIYLVEEVDGGGQAEEFGKDRIRSAMSLTQILDDIRVERTQNMDDTIALLASLHRRIVAKYQTTDLHVIPDEWLSRGNCTQLRKQLEIRDRCKYLISYDAYSEMNSKTKQHTIREVWYKQLTCIRGLTVEKASLVVSEYPTMRSFVEVLIRLPDTKQRMDFIRSLGGQIARKSFGGALCQRIVEFFCSSTYASSD